MFFSHVIRNLPSDLHFTQSSSFHATRSVHGRLPRSFVVQNHGFNVFGIFNSSLPRIF